MVMSLILFLFENWNYCEELFEFWNTSINPWSLLFSISLTQSCDYVKI